MSLVDHPPLTAQKLSDRQEYIHYTLSQNETQVDPYEKETII